MRGAYDIPKDNCPYCGKEVEADYVDVGVGFVQCGPFYCNDCEASEVGPHDKTEGRDDIDWDTGWYKPLSPAGSSANVDDEGRIINYHQADELYRAKHGVGPRRWNT